jgi:5'-nucleotidase
MEEQQRVALIDLDSSVADYDKALTAAMKAIQSPGEPEYKGRSYPDKEEPHIEARRKLIQRQPNFWKDLPELKLGFDIVNEMRRIGYRLHILSKGPISSPYAWTEKLLWQQAHLPDAQTTITSDKSLCYGRVLLDDYPDYFLGWLDKRPRGIVIAVAHPWNQGVKHERVYRYDGSNLALMKEVLQKAYDR